MTDKTILQIRLASAIVTFFALSGTLIPILKDFSIRSQGAFVSLILLLLSFAMVANGVSYLSEILKKNKNILKIVTGILSLLIFVFVFFPQEQDTSPIIGLTILIGLSFSSILISMFSILEFSHELAIRKVYSFVFAMFSGISSCLILSFICRGYNHSDAWLVLVIYGLIMFLISIAVNLSAASSYKNS